MFFDMVQEAEKNSDVIPPFIHEFFNVKIIERNAAEEPLAMSRILNALTNAVNVKNARLPKYLVVILDKDVIDDIQQPFRQDAVKIVKNITDWMVRQINMIMCQKRIDLLDKSPGACCSTNIIFIKMLPRIGPFNESSRLNGILNLCNKANDAMNDAVAKAEFRLLTISSCNAYEDFNKKGGLSTKGKRAFWNELDELIQRFDINKIKLLPNPKNPPKLKPQSNQCRLTGNNMPFPRDRRVDTGSTHFED